MTRMRHHKAHGLDDVRSRGHQHFPFQQRFAHQSEMKILEITQTTMDELGAGGGRVRGEVMLLAQRDLEAAPRRIAGDTGAVDAAADD